ncbi:hypothetical protein GWI33_004688 [Rhynchophorus ferrugineus]|uniref:Uncharacterized protein n=1 Tax=Rhynchophorus ferrugineus TaxID=354439 RepID=A0A834IST9_RHYFE|nr:hypothetical protein GWI33_004688 [Rhynchophorus ferrugineus]
MHFTYTLRQIVNNQTLEALKRSITKTIAEAAPHIQAAKENQIKIIKLIYHKSRLLPYRANYYKFKKREGKLEDS